jgi:hypothetical protein
VLLAGRDNPSNTTVVVGHSFGGLILESALAQVFVGAPSAAVAQDLHELRFPADLVLLVNPASARVGPKRCLKINEPRACEPSGIAGLSQATRRGPAPRAGRAVSTPAPQGR